MTDTKLITLLKTLSSEEFKELEKFISSPYFSRERNFTPLLNVLKQFYPEFESKKLTKENLFNKLYPGEKYSHERSDHKIKILFSGMYKLCLDFLRQIEFNKDNERKDYYLLNQLRLKKLTKDFEKIYSESTKESVRTKGSMFDFINKIFFADLYKSYAMSKQDHYGIFESSIAMRDYSVMAALINCFKHEPEKKVMTSYNVEIPESLTNIFLSNIDLGGLLMKMKETGDRFYPYVLVYYTVYKMERESDNPEHFFALRKLIKQYQSYYGRMERFAFYIMMETYCQIRRAATSSFERELFQIYNEMLESDTYKVGENEKFNLVLFRNMVLLSASLGELEWLGKFIDKYSAELHENHQQYMKSFSLAIVNFEKGNFEKALELLIIIKSELFLYKIDLKKLQLRIYYELSCFEQILSLIDSTNHYLRNTNDLPERNIISSKNFLKYLKELVKIKSESQINKMEIEFIKKNITEEKNLAEKKWLLKKIKELEISF